MSVIKTSQLMLYREIMAVYSQIYTIHINTVCGQNVELLNVKLHTAAPPLISTAIFSVIRLSLSTVQSRSRLPASHSAYPLSSQGSM